MATQRIILFDGVCSFCAWCVRFIVPRDPQGVFRFAPLQSKVGQALLQRHAIHPTALDTMVLIEEGRAFTHSDAALGVARHLRGGWRCLVVFRLVPRFLRDAAYRVVAKYRYRWFGKLETCMVPSNDLKDRFLD